MHLSICIVVGITMSLFIIPFFVLPFGTFQAAAFFGGGAGA
jgi:hypothetical protein